MQTVKMVVEIIGGLVLILVACGALIWLGVFIENKWFTKENKDN